MVDAASALMSLALVLAFGVSTVAWGRLLWHRRQLIGRGFFESLLPARPRKAPFWSPADALLMFGVMIVSTIALQRVMIRYGWIRVATEDGPPVEPTASGVIASSSVMAIAGVTSVLMVGLWLRLFRPKPLAEVGLTCSFDDIKIGLKAALLILPPVMLLSAAVSFLVPYEHPVLNTLAKTASPAVFAVVLICTAVVTPFVEEFLFRGLLQGSLQAISDPPNGGLGSPSDTDNWRPTSYWPLLISSMVFALVHLGGQGAAPIPLFFLALGLGFLYRQTGSLTPPILVHLILNGLTLVVTYLKILSNQAL